MPKPRMPAKKTPGRPRKPAEERLEQFSVRLPPKVKLGLELLAIDGNFSLSRAVEWAVENVLTTHKMSSGLTVEQTLQDFPTVVSGPQRMLLLYRIKPELLDLFDRRVAQMVWESQEMQEANDAAIAEASVFHWKQGKVVEWAATNWKQLQLVAKRQGVRKLAGTSLKEALDSVLEPFELIELNAAAKENPEVLAARKRA